MRKEGQQRERRREGERREREKGRGRGSDSGIFSKGKTFIYYYDIRYVEYINLKHLRIFRSHKSSKV